MPVDVEDWNTDLTEVRLLLRTLGLDPLESAYGQHQYADSPFMYLVGEGRADLLEVLIKEHPALQRHTNLQVSQRWGRAGRSFLVI